MTMNGCHNREPKYLGMDEKQGIVRASIVAYNEGRAGNPYHPGYTEHEAMAWEIGQAEVEKGNRVG